MYHIHAYSCVTSRLENKYFDPVYVFWCDYNNAVTVDGARETVSFVHRE